MLEFLALTFDVLGKILLGITVLLVHRRVIKEHRIDRPVFLEMKREQFLGLLGIIFIVIAYFLELYAKL